MLTVDETQHKGSGCAWKCNPIMVLAKNFELQAFSTMIPTTSWHYLHLAGSSCILYVSTIHIDTLKNSIPPIGPKLTFHSRSHLIPYRQYQESWTEDYALFRFSNVKELQLGRWYQLRIWASDYSSWSSSPRTNTPWLHNPPRPMLGNNTFLSENIPMDITLSYIYIYPPTDLNSLIILKHVPHS